MSEEKIQLVCGWCSYYFKARTNTKDTKCPICRAKGPHRRYVKGQFPRAWKRVKGKIRKVEANAWS